MESLSELFTVFTKTLNYVLFTQEISRTFSKVSAVCVKVKTYHLLFSVFFLMI